MEGLLPPSAIPRPGSFEEAFRKIIPMQRRGGRLCGKTNSEVDDSFASRSHASRRNNFNYTRCNRDNYGYFADLRSPFVPSFISLASQKLKRGLEIEGKRQMKDTPIA